jgi:hypothetical protein
MQTRHNRVRDYLLNLHGSAPQPLRSYLTNQEAKKLTADHYAGRQVFQDMNITGYSGKHRAAVEEAVRVGLSPENWDFWYKARLTYLELGGCYAKNMEPVKRP